MSGRSRGLVDQGAEALLRTLELAVTRRLDGVLQGDHQGFVPGPGSEPGEARGYQPGDDVRRMDWNVTARTGVAHVRTPVADRELETWVVADLTASVDFGTARCEKRDLVVAATVATGHLTARAGNRFGVLVVTGDGTSLHPARPGRDHLSTVLRGVATTPRSNGGRATDLGHALVTADRLARRRGAVVVVSDFMGADGWQRPLRALAARHEVVAVEVVDPRELALPDVGVVDLVDPESGRRIEVDTGDAALRRDFAAAATAQRRAVVGACRGAGADHLVLRTDGDWLSDLVRFVVHRRRRRMAAPAPSVAVSG